MYCGVYAPWDHYPKFLRQSEVMHPLGVLKSFFDGDDVEGHIEGLQTWRHFVVSTGYYKHEQFGPGNILYDYDCNLRLLEALYLLLLEHQEPSFDRHDVDVDQLAREKKQWAWFPGNLKEAWQTDPFLIVAGAFAEVPPQAFRDHLATWLDAALSPNAIAEHVTPGDIITIYEHLVKLYSAAWLIFQRNAEKPFLRDSAADDKIGLASHVMSKPEKQSAIMPMVTDDIPANPPSAEMLGLKEATKLILKTNPSVLMVCHIATANQPFMYMLLVIIPDNHSSGSEETAAKIETDCARLVSVLVFVKKRSWYEKKERKKTSFFYYAFRQERVTYQAKDLMMVESPETGPYFGQKDIFELWEDWGHAGNRKYRTGLDDQINKKYKSCVNEIAAAIAYYLILFITMKTGYKPRQMDLERLLRITRLFTSDVWDVFCKETESSARALALLTQPEEERSIGPEDEAAVNILVQNAHSLILLAKLDYHYLMADTNHR